MALYRLFVPQQAAGANLVYFDLFNASDSSDIIEVVACKPIVSGSTAVIGTVGVDLFLTRTSSIGTGGTLAVAENATLTAPGLVAQDGSQPMQASITARMTPTGGATAGAALAWVCVQPEETLSYGAPMDLARGMFADLAGVIVPVNTGIRVVQGAIASVGNIGFNVLFKTSMKY